MSTSAVTRRGLGALWKQGWNEIPEIMGSTVLAFIGIGMAGYGLYKTYYVNGGDFRKYRMGYVVYRPDDPKAARWLEMTRQGKGGV